MEERGDTCSLKNPHERGEVGQGLQESQDKGGTAYDEIEKYLEMAKEDIFIALNSSSLDYLPTETENQVYQRSSCEDLSEVEISSNLLKTSNNKGLDQSSIDPKLGSQSLDFKNKIVTQRRSRKFGFKQDHTRPSSLKDSRLQEWSQGLLKDFQDIVEEELKSLNSPAVEKEQHSTPLDSSDSTNDVERNTTVSLEKLDCMKYVPDDLNSKVNGSSVVLPELKMGGNQSTTKVPDNWEDDFYTPYKTYTLPRSNQRSFSLIGQRLASSGHPEDKSESCQLISVTHHRYSRSLSLDDGRGLSPWAMDHLRLIDEVNHSQREIEVMQNSDLTLPEGIYGKIRKTGVSQAHNEKLFIGNTETDSSSTDVTRVSNGWTTREEMITTLTNSTGGRNSAATGTPEPVTMRLDLNSSAHDSDLDRSFREIRRSSITSGASSALTIEALGEHDEEWAYADEDDSCVLTDCCNDHCCQITGRNNQSTIDAALSKPDIVVTSPDIHCLKCPRSKMKVNDCRKISEINSNQRKLREGSGRKSEPTFPSPRVIPVSPLLGLPGLEVRRHTLPNQGNKNGTPSNVDSLNLNVPGTPIFNTSSWETLPPAEEMEVMETKPIQVDETQHLSLERPPSRSKSIGSSRSLNSSLSSLSQLSLQGDFSENEIWSPGSKSPDSKSSNSVQDLLVQNSFSPDVFLDPSQIYPCKNPHDVLNNLNKDGSYDENSLKGVFVDTKPVIIKLSPKTTKHVQISNEDISDTRKIFHETHSSLLKNIHVKETHETKAALKDKDIKSYKNSREKSNNPTPSTTPQPLSAVLQPPTEPESQNNELIFTVTVPEDQPSGNPCSEVEPESDSCNNTLDRRKSDLGQSSPEPELIPKNTKELIDNLPSLVITEQEPGQSSTAEGVACASTVNEMAYDTTDRAGSGMEAADEHSDEVSLPLEKQTNQFEKKKNSKGKGATKTTFADLQLFLKEVETRIPSSKETTCSTSFESVLSPMTPSSGEISLFSPATVLDASTQTSFSPPSPTCGSPTFSFTWMSDCGCDGASLEPCLSSIALSVTEDDLDEEDDDEDDDWWVTEGSLSSSPPETPVSMVRDDSSLSLSESLDNLDNNGESGIGTVSTRPSASPPVTSGALDFSGSNLSSEDTGLETSFERRVRRYLPNARSGRSSDHSAHYRRRRPLARPLDSWVRRENQTTQTERQPDSSIPEIRREVRASSEEAQGRPWGRSPDGDRAKEGNRVVRHTHSEPRLSALSNPNLNLRVVNSETTLPPIPHSSSRSFCNPSPLPTLSEGTSITKAHFSRPRNLSLGEVHVPSKAISAPILQRGILRTQRSASITPSDDSPLETPLLSNRTQSEKEISADSMVSPEGEVAFAQTRD